MNEDSKKLDVSKDRFIQCCIAISNVYDGDIEGLFTGAEELFERVENKFKDVN